MSDDDDDEIPDAPWLHLLRPDQLAWREKEHLRGRNPDGFIEEGLREAKLWPEAPETSSKR